MAQAETDRRVWTHHGPEGSLIVHDHVDDSRITATTPAARLRFHTAWALEFKEKITRLTYRYSPVLAVSIGGEARVLRPGQPERRRRSIRYMNGCGERGANGTLVLVHGPLYCRTALSLRAGKKIHTKIKSIAFTTNMITQSYSQV
jgi:hypothetical protein